MLRPLKAVRLLLTALFLVLGLMLVSAPAQAATVDPYIARYLKVTEPIALDLDGQGQTRLFSPADLSQGKQLFKQHCMNCHVGGATLPNPPVSLSLAALKGAHPPRNNITDLVAYMRHPMNYDGSAEIYECREVPESWIPQAQVENLAAFILKAAQTAPGWGGDTF